MTKVSQISPGQLTALLLTGRIAISMSLCSHDASSVQRDGLLSVGSAAWRIYSALYPAGAVVRETVGRGRYPRLCLCPVGKGGGTAVASGYALLCLLIQTMDLLRFNQFVSTTLAPGLSRVLLCAALSSRWRSRAAFYGIQAVRPRGLRSSFSPWSFAVVGIALALLPEMEWIHFPRFCMTG